MRGSVTLRAHFRVRTTDSKEIRLKPRAVAGAQLGEDRARLAGKISLVLIDVWRALIKDSIWSKATNGVAYDVGVNTVYCILIGARSDNVSVVEIRLNQWEHL